MVTLKSAVAARERGERASGERKLSLFVAVYRVLPAALGSGRVRAGPGGAQPTTRCGER